MCTSEEETGRRLSPFVNYFLHHERRVVNRVDDSVVRETASRTTMLRRGRRHTPRWVRLPFELGKDVVAFGAELQTAGAVAFSDKAVLAQHVGDADKFGDLEEMDRTLGFFCSAYGVETLEAVLAADMHPGYGTRRLAEERARGRGIQLVQHHHAHVASVMVEARVPLGERVVGVAVDGLGYGEDGALWGGEVLVASYSEYERVGHLRPQPMPGGDLATMYPVRMLLGILSTFMEEEEALELVKSRGLLNGLRRGEAEARVALAQAKRKDCPLISSVGRTLDAVAALLGVCLLRTYEGEPAMKLEAAAKGGRLVDDIEAPTSGRVVNTSRLLESILEADCRVRDAAFSAIFVLGRALGELAASAANGLHADFVAVSGGAAVNSILVEGMESALREKDLRARLNGLVPPGDGGIALGQVAVAAARSLD